MIVAIWIIAICELIRALQNLYQLMAIKRDEDMRKALYEKCGESLSRTDREFSDTTEKINKAVSDVYTVLYPENTKAD